jgi:conjugative transfer region protein (TIGR03750 family)
MENTESTETLGDRLNAEPVIFRGSTSTELLVIFTCAVAFWVPFGLLIAILIGKIPMVLGIASIGILATVFFGSTLFQYLKRGRPDFYYQHQVIIKLHKWGFRKSRLVLNTAAWSLGRDKLEIY